MDNRRCRANIVSLGHYVPSTVRENKHFESLGLTDDWIKARTGISERRIANQEGTSDLIVPAALQCLAQAGISSGDLDCIIVATITPDRPVPSTASIVQRKIGASNAWGFDVSAASSGFVYALVVASSLVESDPSRRILVCGADKMTSIVNPNDRSTSLLFGDAAGVVLVEASADSQVGILDYVCRMDGSGEQNLYVPAGGSANPSNAVSVANNEHFLIQNGQAVARAAINSMSELATELLNRNRIDASTLDWLVPHQANARILDAVARKIGIEPSKVVSNVDKFGNTWGATIPLCLSEWHANRRFRYGDSVLITAFGAGYTAGSVYMRWGIC